MSKKLGTDCSRSSRWFTCSRFKGIDRSWCLEKIRSLCHKIDRHIYSSVIMGGPSPNDCTSRWRVPRPITIHLARAQANTCWKSVWDFSCRRFLYPQILPLYLSMRLLPQRVQHASAYPGSSVSHNKFHLLYSLLVSSHTNKSTKDKMKFHFTTQLNW